MKRYLFVVPMLALLAAACAHSHVSPLVPTAANKTPTSFPTSTPTSSPTNPTAASAIAQPPITGPDPSYLVGAFYYPWYGNPEVDGEWIHWTQAGHQPPQDIASDYFPELGAYSSNDPAVIAQHMAWLRQAGVGVIIVSWWGQGSREEKPVPLILQTANRYGIKVTFHIEPYAGRTADSLLSDFIYLYAKYGSDPAFFRSTATTRYSPAIQPKPMIFVWDIGYHQMNQYPVQASYWQKTVDAIHALPEGGLVIANTTQASWIEEGHFDGLYNYVTANPEKNGGFNWARSLPPDSLYIPSVIPGFSANRVGYPANTYVPRLDGTTYAEQWTAALGTGVQPAMVTITSFNEWHEGTMIEPPTSGANDGHGYSYSDFGNLAPAGYLDLTRNWIGKYLAVSWPKTVRARISIQTTSFMTTLNVVSGGAWIRPELVSASVDTLQAGMEAGDRFVLRQSVANAKAGQQVEMTWDVQLAGLDPAGKLVLEIDRGGIGGTNVVVYNENGSSPIQVGSFYWAGVTTGVNPDSVEIPAAQLTAGAP